MTHGISLPPFKNPQAVKIGIAAPPEIKIYSGELLDAIREAARQPAPDLDAIDRKLKRKREETE